MYAWLRCCRSEACPTRRVAAQGAGRRSGPVSERRLELVNREVARPTVAEVLRRAGQRAERATGSAVGTVDAARVAREDQLIHRRGA